MTGKEKGLLLVVVFIGLVAAYYFFAYRPIDADIAAANTQLTTLNNELNNLTIEYLKKDAYLEEIADMEDEIEVIEEQFPAGLTQEMIIYKMVQLEREIESLTIPTYSFTDSGILIADTFTVAGEEGPREVQEGLRKTSVNLDVSATYEDMKKMLKYIQEQDEVLSVENLSVSGSPGAEIVNYSFMLSFFALESTDREFIPDDYFGPFEEKEESIFAPFGDLGNVDEDDGNDVVLSEEEDDIVLSVSTIYADRSSVIIYQKDDLTGDTYVRTDNNGMEPLEIVFSQVDDKYYFKYKTSTGSYPVIYDSSAAFIPGNVINMKVFSSSRADESDLSGANVTIINQTDLPVEVVVDSDDADDPRFVIVTQEGSVSVTRVDD